MGQPVPRSHIVLPRLSDEEIDRLRVQWRERYSGPIDRQPPGIIDQQLEDKWNEKQDKASYFWKAIAVIAIGAAMAIAILS